MATIVRPQLTRYEEPIIDDRMNDRFHIITLTASNGIFRFIVLDSGVSHLIEVSTDTGTKIYELEKLPIIDNKIGEPSTITYKHTGVYNASKSLKYLSHTLHVHINDMQLFRTIHQLAPEGDPMYLLSTFSDPFTYIKKFFLLSKDFNKLIDLLPDQTSFKHLISIFIFLAKDYLLKFGEVLNKSDLEDKSFYDYLVTTGITTEKLQDLLALLEGKKDDKYHQMITPIVNPDKVFLPDGWHHRENSPEKFNHSLKVVKDVKEFYEEHDPWQTGDLFYNIAAVIDRMEDEEYEPTPLQIKSFNFLIHNITYNNLGIDLVMMTKHLTNMVRKEEDKITKSDFDIFVPLRDLYPEDCKDEQFEL